MAQDNTLQSAALTDIRAALQEMLDADTIVEYSGTVKGPDEVQRFPSIYYAKGAEDESSFKDVQHVHYETRGNYIFFLYVHESETVGAVGQGARDGDVAAQLDYLIGLVKDKINEFRVDEFRTGGYEMADPPFIVETDEGGLAMTGSPMGMAVITIRLYFPPADAA